MACFLTLAERKYGCRELRRLAKHCHAASRHRQNYQRKTNGGNDSLLVYLQPSPEKKYIPLLRLCFPIIQHNGMHEKRGEQATHTHRDRNTRKQTHTQTSYIWINLQWASSQMPLNLAEGENHAGKRLPSE